MIYVYTVITNDYDDLRPVVKSNGVEYICFTDDPGIPSAGWSLQKADRHNRWYKFHSHELFPDIENTIYIDACGKLSHSPVKIFQELQDHVLGQQLHPVRNCLYKESEVVVRCGLDSSKTVDSVISEYREAGFPSNYGLFANGCLVRKNCPKIKQWNTQIWDYMHTREVKRDQVISQFVGWQLGIVPKVMDLFTWEIHKFQKE